MVEEVQQQNQELLRTLDELRVRQEDLERVNRELEDTNRGVVALYAELEERADHLRRADDLKTRFLSNMTHEFRTPVNSILALTGLLEERIDRAPDQKDELFYIRKSAQQLSDLVDDLLDIAKVEAGKWEMEEAPVPLPDFAVSTAQMVRERARASRITVAVDAGAEAATLRADPRLLRQILLNLIINSIKFTEPGGRVSLGWSVRDNGALALEVRDNGVGMSPEDAKRVLQPFGRGSALLARARHDTGLGLPLCKRFAEMHGGTLEIASALGHGTAVTVVFPAQRVATAAPAEAAAPEREGEAAPVGEPAVEPGAKRSAVAA